MIKCQGEIKKFKLSFMINESFRARSDSPVSSTRSSPPISPGCEDQSIPEGFPCDESFKRPIAPDMRHPSFPPQFYNMYQPQLLLPNNSAFHRPDGSGKSIHVSYLVVFIDFCWCFMSCRFKDAWFRSTSLQPRADSTGGNILSANHRFNG